MSEWAYALIFLYRVPKTKHAAFEDVEEMAEILDGRRTMMGEFTQLLKE